MEPEMTPEEFGKVVEPVLLEYFEHGDTGEVEVGIDILIEWSLTPT
jgi:programmed cell death protein 4